MCDRWNHKTNGTNIFYLKSNYQKNTVVIKKNYHLDILVKEPDLNVLNQVCLYLN